MSLHKSAATNNDATEQDKCQNAGINHYFIKQAEQG